MNDKGTNSYQERNSNINIAEIRFENWCKEKNIQFWRMGFDEKNNRVPRFWDVHPVVRSMPDYICVGAQGLTYMHVKGTNKIKINDLMMYERWHTDLCQDVGMRIVFCFDGEEPIFLKWHELKQKLTGCEIKEWPNDKKQYVEINVRKTPTTVS